MGAVCGKSDKGKETAEPTPARVVVGSGTAAAMVESSNLPHPPTPPGSPTVPKVDLDHSATTFPAVAAPPPPIVEDTPSASTGATGEIKKTGQPVAGAQVDRVEEGEDADELLSHPVKSRETKAADASGASEYYSSDEGETLEDETPRASEVRDGSCS